MCTITCKGVHTHIQRDMNSKRDIEYALGLKYCPGLEPTLPVYTYVGYKPSTSTGGFTIFAPSTATTVLGRVSGGEAVERDDHSGRRRDEEEDVSKEEALRKNEVSILISDWEMRAGGGEVGDSWNLPDTMRSKRRVSQEFIELRQKFVDHSEGGGAKLTGRQKSRTLSTERSELTTTTQGRGAMRKIDFSNLHNSSVVGRGAFLLASPTANKKRKMGLVADMDMESESKRCCFTTEITS